MYTEPGNIQTWEKTQAAIKYKTVTHMRVDVNEHKYEDVIVFAVLL